MVDIMFGLDLGFDQVKVFTQYTQFKYLSMIGNPSAFELEQNVEDPDSMNNLVVTFDEQTVYVGKKALETNNARLCTRTDKTNTENDKAEFYAALGYLHSKLGITQCTVITGLPVEDFKEQGLAQKLSNNLKGTKSFKFGKKHTAITITISDVIVMPQSAGAFYNYVLDNDGAFLDDKLTLIDGEIIVIDVGYKTTDIITMRKGRYVSEKSCTIEKGMKDIHKELQRLIRVKYNRKFSLTEMDDVCRAGQFRDKGIVIDILPLIKVAEKPVASSIINEAYALIGDTREADKVLACGGTMELLFPYFDEYYNKHIEKMINPEYANASGYYKFGKMRYANKSQIKQKK